ncbi:MAG: ABC transporter permease subunit [Candidatus Neomarinimicrobiota bacterium]|jgi:ABC-2 type transport system permease protein|nr:ABC transporter [Candidatus Neomarinimicrobiota bacterium]MEC7798756.1 ABC transporter permease subunit [Candidatus Neomarinimicrobiota bacterium]|tara:strand:- start:1292 stop:2005 length:714 start_codon:yes stop_codon:yes gene_type:complete
MRNINTIFRRELAGFFNSPMAYIFLVIFAIVNGYFFTNTFFLFGQSDLRVLFDIVPLVYLFFIPAVSMGLIAREHNLGTMEIISTLPINNYEFVLGKFFAALSLILLGLVATSIHFFTLIFVGSNVDYGAIFSGYLGLALMGATYAAIGTYSSSVTENQVVSFIIGVFIVLVLFMLDKTLVFIPSSIAGFIQFLSVDYHLSNISRGVIDSRNLIYFISMIGFFIFLTIQTLEVKRWK